MGDRGHNRHGPKEGGALLCPFRGVMGLRLTQCGLGRGLLPYIPSGILVDPAVWPQRTWTENRGCAPLEEGWKLGFHLTQCRLGQGLPPYQVVS